MDIVNKLIEFEKLGKAAKVAFQHGWTETAELLSSHMADIVMELKPLENKILFAQPKYAGLFHALESVYYVQQSK